MSTLSIQLNADENGHAPNVLLMHYRGDQLVQQVELTTENQSEVVFRDVEANDTIKVG